MEKLSRGSKTDEIAFIVCTNNNTYMEECKKYISRLNVPEGVEVSFFSVKNAKSMTAGYNEAMRSLNARYKVYIHQDVFIINKNFIFDILKCFEQDEKLGMIGVAGSREIPSNAYVCTSIDVGGCCSIGAFTGAGSVAVRPQISNAYGLYQEVEYIDGMLMATSYDIKWDEQIEGFHFYDLSQCINYRKQGLKIAVARQDDLWTVHDLGPLDLETYDGYREKFCNIYDDFSFDGKTAGKNIYSLCKKVSLKLKELFNCGEHDKVYDVISDLGDAIYFCQDLINAAFIIEIAKIEKEAYGKTYFIDRKKCAEDFDTINERYLKLRLLLIGIEHLQYSKKELKDMLKENEYSPECVIVTALHNTVNVYGILNILENFYNESRFCSKEQFSTKIENVKNYERENLVIPD